MNITANVMGKAGYTSLLPLSCQVPTFLPSPSGNVSAQGGAPTVDLDDDDLRNRAQRLVNILYWTATTCANQDGMQDTNTLKVFIAPEFYFRKAADHEITGRQYSDSTSYGSYPESSRYALAEALYSTIHGCALFKDWIIVAGSICSKLPDVPGEPMSLLNTAIMLRGLRDQMDDAAPYILMEKHYISNIDGPPASMHANLNPTTPYFFRIYSDQGRNKVIRGMNNIVWWDDMRVGLEVCLDHSQQIVHFATDYIGTLVGIENSALDLQLITSCGMSICNPAVAVGDGRLVMLTDGMNYGVNSAGLPEPRRLQLGRYDAASQQIQPVDPDNFSFMPLPPTAAYCIDYAGLGTGLVQGIWTTKKPLPLRESQP
ncbi:MAG TPA: hypothetical protein VF271_10080 [Rhodanobacteraceae bacterium]